jgi:hypothetical protein
MNEKSLLVNGKIPPHTECPFKEECSKTYSDCRHTGINHDLPYSCGYARLFNIFLKREINND